MGKYDHLWNRFKAQVSLYILLGLSILVGSGKGSVIHIGFHRKMRIHIPTHYSTESRVRFAQNYRAGR